MKNYKNYIATPLQIIIWVLTFTFMMLLFLFSYYLHLQEEPVSPNDFYDYQLYGELVQIDEIKVVKGHTRTKPTHDTYDYYLQVKDELIPIYTPNHSPKQYYSTDFIEIDRDGNQFLIVNVEWKGTIYIDSDGDYVFDEDVFFSSIFGLQPIHPKIITIMTQAMVVVLVIILLCILRCVYIGMNLFTANRKNKCKHATRRLNKKDRSKKKDVLESKNELGFIIICIVMNVMQWLVIYSDQVS